MTTNQNYEKTNIAQSMIITLLHLGCDVFVPLLLFVYQCEFPPKFVLFFLHTFKVISHRYYR